MGFIGDAMDAVLPSSWLGITDFNGTGQKAAAAAADQIRNSSAQPADPMWQDYYGAGDALGNSQQSIDNFANEANRQGPSNYANLATNQQSTLANQALDRGANQVAGQGATARSQLAMRGGLTGGAAERLATEGQKNYLDMSQGINQNKANNIQQIGMNDEQNRISQLGMLPGMEQGQASATAGLNNQRTAFDTNKYNTQMAGWAANQTAGAQREAGKNKQGTFK